MDYIYLSSGNFGAQILQNLDPKPSLVITGADKLGGRGMKEMISTPVKKLCFELKIPFKEVANKSELVSTISKLPTTNHQLLLADFGIIIPSELLHLNDYGIWNIHPSLLPKYRGTTPIQTALANGETATGVTIMKMDEKIDHGPIIAQAKVTISNNETNSTLQTTLAKIGANLFNTIAESPAEGHEQDDANATFTKKLTKEDGFIPLSELAPYLEPLFKKYNLTHLLPTGRGNLAPTDTNLLPSPFDLRLHNMIRAFLPWPTVWTKLTDDSVVKITGSEFDEENQKIAITEIERNGKKYSFISIL